MGLARGRLGAIQAVADLRRKAICPLMQLLLLVIGLLLVTRARSWSEWLALRIQLRNSRATADVAAFIVSLGQIVAPMIGVVRDLCAPLRSHGHVRVARSCPA